MAEVPPLASFRLYPARGRRFVRVNIWPTLRAFFAHSRREGHIPASGPGVRGSCTPIHRSRYRNGRWRRDPLVAEVNLVRGHIGMEIVTHELFHATLAWGRRIGFDWSRLGADDCVNADEERLTYVHGWLCGEYVRAAEAAGLYDPKRWQKRIAA